MINRRELLHALGYSAIGGCTALHGLGFAAESNHTLVIVFLRGGADSLHMAAPIDDVHYISARPPELRILDAGKTPGILLPKAFAPQQDCRLHPAAAPLLDLFQSQRAQLLHACGLANATRSHFVAQEIIESALPHASHSTTAAAAGWLSEVTAPSIAGQPVLSHLGTSAAQIRSLQGIASAIHVPGELRNNLNLPGDAAGKLVLEALYASTSSPGPPDMTRRVGQDTLKQLALIDAKLPRTDGKVTPYVPPKGVSYNTENQDWLHAMQTVAQLIRMDIGLQVACVDLGGWDTHEYQPGRLNNLVRQWSSNLRALIDDMQSAGKHLSVLTVSEFGRRLRSNASQGTDHGHAGAVWLLDTRARSLLPETQWPGLATQVLDQGLDLAHTHEVKQVLRQVALQSLKI